METYGYDREGRALNLADFLRLEEEDRESVVLAQPKVIPPEDEGESDSPG